MAPESIAARGKSAVKMIPGTSPSLNLPRTRPWCTGVPQRSRRLSRQASGHVYRARNEIQELSFKGMIDHGGLDINFGHKTILGPDRHHQRKKEQLEQSLETAHTR